MKDDDAAEDQEDDGPFGADLGRGKPMPDAADFDDQVMKLVASTGMAKRWRTLPCFLLFSAHGLRALLLAVLLS